MAYEVIITKRAEEEILEIGGYIASNLNAPFAASQLLDDIDYQIDSLNMMPKRHALVSEEHLAERGVRHIPVKNYIIFYEVNDDTQTVEILSVMYARRNWESLL